jgi:putative copper export protein
MTGGPGSNGGVPRTSPDKELDPRLRDPDVRAWMGEHLPELRRSAYGQRLLYQSLAVAFVVGLAAHVGGYLLRPSPPTEPLGLVADLLYALGFALWTGVVVVLFVQVVPEVKRRQFKQALDAYEAAQREQARAGSDQASGDDGAPTAR